MDSQTPLISFLKWDIYVVGVHKVNLFPSLKFTVELHQMLPAHSHWKNVIDNYTCERVNLPHMKTTFFFFLPCITASFGGRGVERWPPKPFGPADEGTCHVLCAGAATRKWHPWIRLAHRYAGRGSDWEGDCSTGVYVFLAWHQMGIL